MITYDGKVIGNEVMPTLGLVKMLGEQPICCICDELSLPCKRNPHDRPCLYLGAHNLSRFGPFLQAGEGALSNPYFEDYPQAEKYAISGYQPVKTLSELVVETNQFRTGLVLSSEYTTADA